MSKHCTCDSLNCPHHPTNHDRGCTPCIEKNLRTREIPGCFFHLMKNADTRQGDGFADFAKLVLEEELF